MSEPIKIIIKDKFSNKLVALKLKEDTLLTRVIEVLQKKYEHLQNKNLSLFLRGEELSLELTLQDLVDKKSYTENDRIEIEEKQAAEAAIVVAPEEPNFVQMMQRGGTAFEDAVLEILVRGNVILRDVAESALATARQKNKPFVTTLIEGAYLGEKDILTTISRSLEVPSVGLEGITIVPDVLKLVPQKEAEYFGVIPTRREQNTLWVAMANPFDAKKLHDLRTLTGCDIEPALSTEYTIRNKIKQLYAPKPASPFAPAKTAAALPPKPAPFSTGKPAATPAAPPAHEDSALSDDFFSSLDKSDKKGPLVIRDGKKVEAGSEIPKEEFEAATVWADKEEILKPLDEDEPAPSKEIWEAPTLMTKDGKKANAPQPEPKAVQPESESEGLTISPDDLLQGMEISPDASEPSLPPGLEISPEGMDLTVPEGMQIEADEAVPEAIPAAKPVASTVPAMDDAALGDAIPIYPGTGEEAAQAIAISPDSDDMPAETAARTEPHPAKDADESSLLQSDLIKTERMGVVKGGKKGLTPSEQAETALEADIGDDVLAVDGLLIPDAAAATADEVPVALNQDEQETQPRINIAPIDMDSGSMMPEEEDKPQPLSSPKAKSADDGQTKPILGQSQPASTPISGAGATEPGELELDLQAGISPTSSPEPVPISADTKEPEQYQFQTGKATIAPLETEAKEDQETTPTSDYQKTIAKSSASPAPANIAELDTTVQIANEKLESAKNKAQELCDLQQKLAAQQEQFAGQHGQIVSQLVNQIESVKAQAQTVAETYAALGQKVSPTVVSETRSASVPKAKKFMREVAVRYYRQLHPYQTLPLSVLFSHLKKEAPVVGDIAQVNGQPVAVHVSQPLVTVKAHVPGCFTVPPEIILDLTPAETSAKFWVTPLAEGKISEAQVEIWQQNKCLQKIPLSLKVVRQWPAKLSVAFGFLFPILTWSYERYGGLWLERLPDVAQKWMDKLPALAQPLGGIWNLGLAVGGSFMILAMLLAFLRKSKQGAPVVGQLSGGDE